MSESSYKIRSFKRRQPMNRSQKPRQVPKPQGKETSQQQRPPVAPSGTVGKRRGVVRPKKKTAANQGIPSFKPSNPQLKRIQKRGPSKKVRSRKTQIKPMAKTMLYALRLLIVGVGIGAIVGTVLSVLDPATRLNTAGASNSNLEPPQSQSNSGVNFYLTQEILPLKTAVQTLAAANPSLKPGVFLVDLDTGAYVDINANSTFAAASTIKLPILVAFFQDVDAGKIRLDETLTMEKDMVAGGSGNIQYQEVGTQYTALEVASLMMTISDNTATNMLIARMGGIDTLNQRFRSWGLTSTALRNPLPDIAGTNTTSPKELGNLMAMVSKGKLVSMTSRDRLLDIMRRNTRNELLPKGLGKGATIAHKTGNIGAMLADAGLIDLPTGKRYIAAVMVQRPRNDASAQELIRSISSAAYQQFYQSFPTMNGSRSNIPAPGMQSPKMTPQTGGNTVPMSNYQSPAMNNIPNNTTNTIPINNYQSVPNSQYYYPYQSQR